ncbi:hybrid sensor histidine kinase/response regulator [Methylibium sp.]|uniref:hybrid sensor histidine kinase/response regulator n=1 Tax=Methylibium sp. TaxID=2067992 RepID=UPI0026006E25|nr:hybrid sensor histidine kinase/response regulator [Methylibium sp.]
MREERLRAGEEDLARREVAFARREAEFDAKSDAAMTQPSQSEERARQVRDANERLVIASMNAQQLAEAAEEANARKDDFLAMLSHELRNPLAPIRNAAAILARIEGGEPRLPWIRNLIEQQVEQMSLLLDDLLDVARVRSGKIVLKKRPVAVHEFLERAIESCRPLAESRSQQLTAALPAQPVFVDGDPARLTQVFSNLLNNAAKYTRDGGTIRLSVEPSETALIARVKDNGSGLAPEALERVFGLFSQEDRSLAHAQGGLGIGLTVVRRLVELHGGTVTVTSDGLNCGSEFVVTLPLLKGPEPAVAVPRVEAVPRRSLRIAVIEDNRDSNDSLSTLLRIVGHEVVSAFDGVSGLALVLAERPQLVLCDIGLPGMDGLAVAARLRKEWCDSPPVLVALTGYGQAEDRARAEAAGFELHLTKPVDTDLMIAMIDRHAERLHMQPPVP